MTKILKFQNTNDFNLLIPDAGLRYRPVGLIFWTFEHSDFGFRFSIFGFFVY